MQETKKRKMRQLKKPWFWNGSIAAALLAAIAVFAVMLQLEKNVLTKYEKGVIYVAAREIPEGQLVTAQNADTYFEQKMLDKSCIPETALYRQEQVEGLIAAAPIEKGVLLTEGMFESENQITAQMSEPVITGFKAEDLYQVVGGVLRSGDRIHIYRVTEEGEALLVWENLFVQEVFDQSGSKIANDDVVTSAQRINVYIDKKDVEKFYSELTSGTLRVAKVCKHDNIK